MRSELIDRILNSSLVRFIGVGVINTAVGTAIMFIFYNVLHFDYWISSASNYIVGGAISYYLNKNYTFRYKGGDWRVLLRFIINISVCYFIAYGLAKPVVEHLLSGQDPLIQGNVAMIVGMVLYVCLNYIGQRFFTFRTPEDGADA